MLESILTPITKLVLALISGWGYAGIVACMTIESACIPLPSEIIMPFSGYLASTGRFTLWGVALAGAFGNVFGSWIGYALGAAGGRPLAERLSRWRIIRISEYDRGNGWLKRHGTQVAFWTRLLPIVRTFISFPAGAARVPLARFTIYTFLGSFLWALGLAWIGSSLGAHWVAIRAYARGFDLVIALGLVALFLLWLRSHLRSS
jgi:membrane protein DedA with SNARE-associated domain